MKLLSLSLVFLLAACQPQTLAPIEWPEYELISCDDYASKVTPTGLLYNNVWNKNAAKNADARQCLVERPSNEVAQYGWLWDWPTSPKAIFAQPQIKIGSSPWDPSPKFGDDLPLKISDVLKLNLAHELDIISNGNFNVATTMWLTQTATPNKDSIAAELMIWTYYTKGQFKPGGRKVETFTLNGLEWELWEDFDWNDKSGVNQNQWRYVAFRLAKPSLKVEYDAKALIQYALDRQAIDARWYIADLELGTEVMGGQGLAWIEQFTVRIEH